MLQVLLLQTFSLGLFCRNFRQISIGALGNLVRNSEAVIDAMVSSNAVQALLKLVLSGKARADKSDAGPMKIALFSLGNFASYHPCRRIMREIGTEKALSHFLSSPGFFSTSMKLSSFSLL